MKSNIVPHKSESRATMLLFIRSRLLLVKLFFCANANDEDFHGRRSAVCFAGSAELNIERRFCCKSEVAPYPVEATE